jgi:hypothetical protein
MKTAYRKAAHAKRQNQDHLTSWIRVIAGNKAQPEENADQINIAIRKAYELLKCGQASDTDFDRVASALNVGLARAELIDPLAEQTMQAGINAMYSCAEIYKRHGRYGFTGPDINAVNDALGLYEDILRLSTPKMMCDATTVAFRRCSELARTMAGTAAMGGAA